jgi:glycosyltransferase involved in cell wall biosynthesis
MGSLCGTAFPHVQEIYLTLEGIEMKVAVITTKAAMSKIWNHAEKASSHDMHVIPVTEFKSKVGVPRMGGWHCLKKIAPDCIWVDHHNIEGLYCRLFQVYGHEDVPVIGYLRGDIWTEVSDLVEYLMNKWKRELKEKKNEKRKDKISLLSLLKGRTTMDALSIGALYDASLPFILAYDFHFSFLRNLSMGRYDLLVCISRWLEERAHQEMPKISTDVWYRGMDPSPFLHAEPMDLLHPCVGIVQNHSIMRKTKPLLDFSSVVKALPDIHFYVSEGVSRWSEFLPQVKQAFSTCENVHFLKVTPRNISGFMTSVDCYALVSGLDAFPSTVREAQLAKAPVVASKVGGVEEALAKSPWNAAIDNEDTESWVRTLREFVKGKGENEEGRQYVASTFRWEVAIEKFNKICFDEIKRKKS